MIFQYNMKNSGKSMLTFIMHEEQEAGLTVS